MGQRSIARWTPQRQPVRPSAHHHRRLPRLRHNAAIAVVIICPPELNEKKKMDGDGEIR